MSEEVQYSLVPKTIVICSNSKKDPLQGENEEAFVIKQIKVEKKKKPKQNIFKSNLISKKENSKSQITLRKKEKGERENRSDNQPRIAVQLPSLHQISQISEKINDSSSNITKTERKISNISALEPEIKPTVSTQTQSKIRSSQSSKKLTTKYFRTSSNQAYPKKKRLSQSSLCLNASEQAAISPLSPTYHPNLQMNSQFSPLPSQTPTNPSNTKNTTNTTNPSKHIKFLSNRTLPRSLPLSPSDSPTHAHKQTQNTYTKSPSPTHCTPSSQISFTPKSFKHNTQKPYPFKKPTSRIPPDLLLKNGQILISQSEFDRLQSVQYVNTKIQTESTIRNLALFNNKIQRDTSYRMDRNNFKRKGPGNTSAGVEGKDLMFFQNQLGNLFGSDADCPLNLPANVGQLQELRDKLRSRGEWQYLESNERAKRLMNTTKGKEHLLLKNDIFKQIPPEFYQKNKEYIEGFLPIRKNRDLHLEMKSTKNLVMKENYPRNRTKNGKKINGSLDLSRDKIRNFHNTLSFGPPSSRQDAILLEQWLDNRLTELTSLEASIQSHDIFELTQCIYYICMKEIIRQISVQCAERGSVLWRIFKAYIALIQKTKEESKAEQDEQQSDYHKSLQSFQIFYERELQKKEEEIEKKNKEMRKIKKEQAPLEKEKDSFKAEAKNLKKEMRLQEKRICKLSELKENTEAWVREIKRENEMLRMKLSESSMKRKFQLNSQTTLESLDRATKFGNRADTIEKLDEEDSSINSEDLDETDLINEYSNPELSSYTHEKRQSIQNNSKRKLSLFIKN